MGIVKGARRQVGTGADATLCMSGLNKPAQPWIESSVRQRTHLWRPSYAARKRTQEIGIRMALGAQRTSILWLILRQGLALSAVGLAVGIIAAAVLTRVISGPLFGVTPTDPLTFASVAAVLLAVAIAATLFSSLRASGVDPLLALRAD
jgi:predicted lysophospholipase L1 biosynthesis ABC-type transport system permease subunit